jgi:protein-S-isoprenylcysteine O-methyltransferase Ste14
VLGLINADPLDRLTPVRLTIAALNTVVGVLFVARAPAIRHGSTADIAVSIPAVLIAGIALKLSPLPRDWPLWAELPFAAGAALATTSFVFLGRSFAILPAVRGVVSRGPYGLVRHPAYLGELLMVLSCFAAGPTALGLLPLAFAVPLVVLRIRAEEHALQTSAEYGVYATRVRWRLLPGVW